MSNRKMKKSFPLDEFSVLFSQNINATIDENSDPIEVLKDYPNIHELENIITSIRKSLRFIILQEIQGVAYVIDKKQYYTIIRDLPVEMLKAMKRTGFKAESLQSVKLIEEKFDKNTIIFVSDSIYYRMLINANSLSQLGKYVERNRFYQITDPRKDYSVKRYIFQTPQDISILKLKVLIAAVCMEIKDIIF